MKTIVAVLLILHGLITVAIAGGSFNRTAPGVPNPASLSWWPVPMGRSWLLSMMGERASGLIAPVIGVIWLLGGVAIVAAGMGLLGFIVPVAYWRLLAGLGAALSLIAALLYAHPYYAVGIVADLAILVVLLWAKWPSVRVLGS